MSISTPAHQRVERQQAQRGRAVDEDEVVAVLAESAAVPILGSARSARSQPALPGHDADQLDLRAGQVDRGRDDIESGQVRRGDDDLRERACRRPARRRSTGSPRWCSTPSAVEALPCGSRSTTSTRCPIWASAAPRFTVVVVLPTPPFWLATTMTRVAGGRGKAGVSRSRARKLCSMARARGVVSSAKPGALLASSPAVRTVKPARIGVVFHVKPREFRYVAFPASAVDENGESVDKRAHVTRSRRWKTSPSPPPASTPGPAATTGRPAPPSASGQPTPRPAAQATRTPRAGDGTRPSPSTDHLRRRAAQASPARPAPPRPRPRRCCPSWPPAPRRARHQRHRPAEQPVERRDRARGHDVETLAPVQLLGPAAHDRHAGRAPDRATTSSRNVVRRSSGSTRVTVRSGRAMASTRPGRPAPEPTSHTRAPSGTSLGQHRAVEQVPLPQPGHLARADQTPDRARVGQPARRTPRQRQSRSDANTPRAASGAGGAVSRETTDRSASGRVDHHEPARLDALGLRDQAGCGHRVVDDLPLERGHRVERHRLPDAPCTSAIRSSASASSVWRALRRGGRRCRASAATAPRSRGTQPGG